MKNRIAVLAVILVLFTLGSASAQIRDETILTYEVLTEEWDDLIAGVLDLTEEEAAGFWPLYEDYTSLKGMLWAERIDVIAMFLTGYDTMGAEIARGLLGASFEIEGKMLALEREYAGLFDDVIPLNKVVRLFQAENKLETTMMMEIAKDIPLAK
ncbi:MAG: hypothetical protein QNL88_14760 [Acidobacteriota bacterium]|nr:hypothetical protein [Acidobacteriota bacterium]